MTPMTVLHRGFDGLDVAFQGRIPPDFLFVLEEAKVRAIQDMQSVMTSHRNVPLEVAETGARGGYAFRCDTGPFGATWFFKKPKAGDPWGVRVSVKSLALALYGLGGVRARLYEFMERLGIAAPLGGESIGRIDYAVDILAPGFVLVPDNFVMHSHANRADHCEPDPMVRHGTSGRVTSVTVGRMPNRQIIIYDKRKEVVDKRKVHWWKIWNVGREQRGEPLLDPKDRHGSQVWRVELRAGKEHLKRCWGGKKWQDLDDKLGSLLLKALDDIRYATPTADTNRSRWPDHPMWNLVHREVGGDLFEMMCPLDPNAIKEVLRREYKAMLGSQLRGLSAPYAVACGLSPSDADKVPAMIERDLRHQIATHSDDFQGRMERAGARLVFLNPKTGGDRP